MPDCGRCHAYTGTAPSPKPFHLCQNIPAGGPPSHFASFTQNGETKALRRKPLNLTAAAPG